MQPLVAPLQGSGRAASKLVFDCLFQRRCGLRPTPLSAVSTDWLGNMTPFLFHFFCIAVVFVVAWNSKRRMVHLHQRTAEDAKVFEYSDGAKAFTIAGTIGMGFMLLWAEALQEAQNPDNESIVPFGISILFAAFLFVVLDRRLVLTGTWISSGLSILNPPRFDLTRIRGAPVSSTVFFGGVTTILTTEGRLKIWHQLDNSKVILQRVLPLTQNR